MSLCLQCIALNEEEKLCFRDSERTKEYGWIGYLRGDFGRSGEEFHSTWFEGDNPELMDGELAPMKEVIAVFAVRANIDHLLGLTDQRKNKEQER